jgi:DNA-binding LytR/AlgR family response regulator
MEVQKIVIASKKGQIVVRISDILYVESANKVQLVHIASNIIEAKHNMNYFEENLPEDEFIRSHRCYLVNGRCIARVASDEIEMDNGDILPISRRCVHEIQDFFRRLNVE